MSGLCDRPLQDIVDAAYRSLLEPAGWHEVMALLRRRFPSTAQTLYVLDRDDRKVRAICLDGIDRHRLADFDAFYFAADNPWMRVSQHLHRPGIVRTNERLDAHLRVQGALYTSSYYHEWMRPQDFHFTMGNTLHADARTVTNITLMRPAGMGTFDDAELRDFEALTPHLWRAMGVSMRLEHEVAARAQADALEALPWPVALVAPDLALVHANPAMERLLAARHVLVLRHGRLGAACHDDQAGLVARVDMSTRPAQVHGERPQAVWLRSRDGRAGLRAEVLPCPQRRVGLGVPRRLALIAVQPVPAGVGELRAALMQLHGLTRSEAGLATLLADGTGLRDAAARAGITYGSARVYLKSIYRKLDVHDRAQLALRLARLGGEAALPPALRGDGAGR
jgi:DNA-binding CsgD family transcriptional regulator/PAS domain-containing protein